MTALIDLATLALILAAWFALGILAVLVFHMVFGRKPPKPEVDWRAFQDFCARDASPVSSDVKALAEKAQRGLAAAERAKERSQRYGRHAA